MTREEMEVRVFIQEQFPMLDETDKAALVKSTLRFEQCGDRNVVDHNLDQHIEILHKYKARDFELGREVYEALSIFGDIDDSDYSDWLI